VALIDSGVTPVPGLDGAGKVINGPDLSFESQAPNLRNADTYGHGTHMAGIIAGRDRVSGTGTARFAGVAPGAHLVSLKVATADGASDVSQVIAAIDWVVAHRNDAGLNIRVLNLSFGTRSTQSAAVDPLSFAVQQAWNKGIVVVVAAGNDGFAANSVTMPAANPDVIAVGAADPKGTDVRADDVVADFSNRGNAARHPDVLAAGRSVVSLRNPGSYLDVTYPGARVATSLDPAQRFFRGSGTSQAAAVVSGSVALLLQQRPNLTPDQVKRLLTGTAYKINKGDAYAAGAGQIDIAKAARAKTTASFTQLNGLTTGLGSLERSRGGAYVYDSVTGTALTGEKDIFGRTWSPPTWSLASKTQRSWNGGLYNGSVWTGSGYGTDPYGRRTWSPVTWSGRSWSNASWSGRSWSGAVWTGRSWSSQTWSGRSWSGRSWSSAAWAGAPWQ
jgi:serine protease AprX